MSVVFAVTGDWALASDGYQWIVQRRAHWKGKVQWRSLSFVHSTKTVLARCLREKGCPLTDAERLLAGLPGTFDLWQEAHPRLLEASLNAKSTRAVQCAVECAAINADEKATR